VEGLLTRLLLVFAVATSGISGFKLGPHSSVSAGRLAAGQSAPVSPSRMAVPTQRLMSLPAGCASTPHLCGFPDATNTGAPAGMALKIVPDQVSSGPGWHYDPRGWVEVDGDGAVLSGLYIPYNLDISASNVTIFGDRIMNSGPSSFGISLRHTQNVTIENSDIYAPNGDGDRLMVGIKDIYGDSTNTTILRNNIWYTSTGVQIGEGQIADNYIHDPGFRPGDHINGITSNGGRTTPLTVEHNTVFVNFAQSDAISLFEDYGIQANRVISDNLLAGGAYTIYGGQGSKGTPFNIRITNNRIATIYFARGGNWGPVAHYDAQGLGNTWTGNVWDDTGVSISSAGGDLAPSDAFASLAPGSLASQCVAYGCL
jgi:Right handed beta helix region